MDYRLLLFNAPGEEQAEEGGVTWLLQYIGEAYNDPFAAGACKLGSLLAPKVMDAESSYPVCEEAHFMTPSTIFWNTYNSSRAKPPFL